ncbi:D-alanine--D-alanine ligase family protein [Aspergillus saccharolyticus JOP 1030-1]|uniref:D-alanine--D-alanine ligase n=1 Tax=Aspergillus saccharolyticus JOP 1030-1 TaxID=1450539 RepID=A0A318ZSC5_9EURO|nr:D-alanine--D-alanine ligase [Aspergillus saccharolyticus JOP 1030-1]PYH42978.1 D-alanine--D-alanine ligase [Aspergillus saccharolyticus JOP 1030-1]
MTKHLTIALIYEEPSDYHNHGHSPAAIAHLEVGAAAPAIAAALQSRGHTVLRIPSIHALVARLATHEAQSWDLAFDITEGVYGPAREAQVAAMLEAYQVPRTFSDAATMALCLDKGRTKMVLEHFGVPTAPFAVVHFDEADPQRELTEEEIVSMMHASRHAKTLLANYPLFAKPLAEGSSKGIAVANKILSAEQLAPVVNALRASSPSSLGVMVEMYLPGREFTVGIAGTGADAWVVGVDEIVWRKDASAKPAIHFTTEKSKSSDDWNGEADEIKVSREDKEADLACHTALRAWRALRCRDGGRVDVRMDASGIAHIMEINPLAGLLPRWSQLPLIAEHNGVTYDELINHVVQSALERRSPKTV